MIKTFSHTGAKKIVFGKGSISMLGAQIREQRASHPLIVMDQNLAQRGLQERIAEILASEGIKHTVYDKVEPEPPIEHADEGARIAVKNQCDIVVGIGGGSVMDTAKAIAVLAANKGSATDYLGLNKVPKAGLPKIMIPTTAGTGSEVTFTAVFIRKNLKKKEGINSPYLYPELALLDPELTVSLPPAVTAQTGLDALCHAIESYTSINASPMSEMFSLQAISLISANLRTCVHNGGDISARENMLLGSLYAGIGLANAGVTAVHSLSYPLGGGFGVGHGLANTILLAPVMTYNLPGALEKFADVAEAMGECTDGLPVREVAYLAVDAVEALIEDCGITSKMKDFGVKEEDFPALADVAATVARPLENNPRKITKEDMIAIYAEAF
ncbi:MAG TPA: iron-containing alcohol dehydrogenase [Smithellaceae bacterium]|nr:iron-containing alcohol dehydrogenase [Smithellaceae bacterium]HQM44474.1 iron-containing alcohol dehydrogenase [Smithellaceae bacterium]